MLKAKKITFIGGGNMGEAIVAALVNQSLIAPQQITVSDPVLERGQILTERYNIHYTPHNLEAIAEADIVVLAVKPQFLDDVMAQIGGKLISDGLVLSIMAGVPIQKMRQGLQAQAIVRVMPNTPAQVNQGMSVWTATADVSESQRQQAKIILGALGKEIFVEKEHYLDMATALSGSGPGYVFLFIEALIDAGVQMGFANPVAREMVLQTISGSVELLRQSGQHPAQLRNMVTSPGGTTAAGLYELEKGAFRATLADAVLAAYHKSIELGG